MTHSIPSQRRLSQRQTRRVPDLTVQTADRGRRRTRAAVGAIAVATQRGIFSRCPSNPQRSGIPEIPRGFYLRAPRSGRPCLRTQTPGWATPWSSAGNDTNTAVSRCPGSHVQRKHSEKKKIKKRHTAGRYALTPTPPLQADSCRVRDPTGKTSRVPASGNVRKLAGVVASEPAGCSRDRVSGSRPETVGPV